MANLNRIFHPPFLGIFLCLGALIWGALRLSKFLAGDNQYLNTMRVGRMFLFRWLMIGSIGIVLTTHAVAQNQKSYTVNDLIFIALESSPQVLAARDQSKAVKGQLSTTGPLTVGNVSSWSVTQPLDMPYTRFPKSECCRGEFALCRSNASSF